ncbi:MAG: carboxypeptidase regulatory-like domain-containing protein [Burkholderiales bacterium]|nr:carboxypeptidase regulatory-like domain-containing protein [Burkholderiales bacterium]
MKNIISSALLFLMLGANAHGALLKGHIISSEGAPLPGVMVTLWNDQENRKETVYTNANGDYKLHTNFQGNLKIRARHYNFADSAKKIAVTGSDVTTNFVVEPLLDALSISNSLTASAHAATLPFPDGATKETFISQCSYCHQQGNSLTRSPRSHEAWGEVISRMEGYGAIITNDQHNAIKNLYALGFRGEPVVRKQTGAFSLELADAKVEEWHAGDAMSFIHDTVVGRDGKLYGIDEGKDVVFVLDRSTGVVQTVAIPAQSDDRVGGNFRGAKLPIGVFTGVHGPHSAVQLRDGRIFITAALSGKLIEFHPDSHTFKFHQLPAGFLWRENLYPHTIRLDRQEKIWFTVTMSNRVAKFDPDTGEFTSVALPHDGFARWVSDNFLGVILKIAAWWPGKNIQLDLSHHKLFNFGRSIANMPYGIDVNPVDGSIWYGKLLGNKIGVIDKNSLEIAEFSTPANGPRRMRFDSHGILWIPSFDDGKLMRFDPKTKSFQTYDLPLLAKDEYEMPYALAVHPSSGDIWIAANNSDRVLRFLPRENRYVAYPMPNRVTWFRDFDFTADGKVCTSNSNLPAYAHEDQVAAFVCISP